MLIVIFVWIVFAVLSTTRGNGAFLGLGGALNYLDVASQVGILATAFGADSRPWVNDEWRRLY